MEDPLTSATPFSPISKLPPELLNQTLSYLPLAVLFTFARTSKRHYAASILALRNLQLAILPRRLHGVLAFLNSSDFDEIEIDYGMIDSKSSTHNQIIVTSSLPVPLRGNKRSKRITTTPAEHREQLLNMQNAMACSILSKPNLSNLHCLTLHIYDVTTPLLTRILATHFAKLRQLHLNFSHPYLHDPCLPAGYWKSPLPSNRSDTCPIWDPIAGIGGENEANLKLTNLEKLTLERADMTSVQLQKIVQRNRGLSELTLKNVTGVDLGFVQWLGAYHEGRKAEGREPHPVWLRSLALESCQSLKIYTPDKLAWLDGLFDVDHVGHGPITSDDEEAGSALRALSLHGSDSVSTPALFAYIEKSRPPLRQLTLPDGRLFVARTRPRPSPSSSGSTQKCTPGESDSSQSRRSSSDSGYSDSQSGLRPEQDDDTESAISYLRDMSFSRSHKGEVLKHGSPGIIEPDTR